ncbi:MAG: hypothetical protein KDJ55_07000 [Rhodobiaceae bacterium]|nr:hypothetical protein [Rhodobiaceae bacterium]MCC0011859.1 hypothetical protein [Rhodobiaceae bacterium]MCC0050484.1 hypothetical protein [Rhodobiaceae bacterium]MCC0061223.1 hypothetical protein [Rhodobiaceae bacterium]
MGRPLADKSISALEAMFDRGRHNPEILESLFVELRNRDSRRAKELLTRLYTAVGILNNRKKLKGP